MLNKELVKLKLNGAGKTIHLLCTASTLSEPVPLQVNKDDVSILCLNERVLYSFNDANSSVNLVNLQILNFWVNIFKFFLFTFAVVLRLEN